MSHLGSPSYLVPFAWWGTRWTPPPPRTLVDLLRADLLAVDAAAFLWAWLARRRSVVVAAGPRGAGKSTLLAALLAALPPATACCYLRGCYESFAFLSNSEFTPGQTLLVINEISPHLPMYLWGPGVERALRAAAEGYALAATMHGGSPAELVAQLTGYPLRLPAPLVAALELAVFLGPPRHADGLRAVARIVRLAPSGPQGITLTPLWDRSRADPPELDLEALRDVAPTITAGELAARADHLTRWRDTAGPVTPTLVATALAAFDGAP